jgi:acetolactate synthase regulatory subunit
VTAIAIRSASPQTTAQARRRRLSLATAGDRDVLLRVLTVLRRRRFQVLSVEFRAGDRHAPPVLELSVEAPTRTGHQLEAWLSNIVGVVSVTDREQRPWP